MGKDNKKKKRRNQKEEHQKKSSDADSTSVVEGFDFGGLPSGISFKKNMGCGG